MRVCIVVTINLNNRFRRINARLAVLAAISHVSQGVLGPAGDSQAISLAFASDERDRLGPMQP
jgi:hypothetical protein